MHHSQEVAQPLQLLLAVFTLLGCVFFFLFLNKEEFVEISWKKTQEIKNSGERKLNLMKTSQQKNPMKLPDEKISSSVV